MSDPRALRLSVAICTHNRASTLRRALEALSVATRPMPCEWEVVVVLNDCVDRSAEVAGSFAGRLPIRGVLEPKRGISHARNRATAECEGDFIIFLDDDILAGSDLLVAYERAIRKWPDGDLFAGPITPLFEGRTPGWLPEALPSIGSAYGRQVVTRDGARMIAKAPPFGANFAIRKKVQAERLYDPSLGRGRVNWLRAGEDTDVLGSVLASGSPGYWVADASVGHVIGPERQTLGYLRRYYEGYGIFVELRDGQKHSGAWGSARLLADILYAEFRYRLARLTAPPERWSAWMARAAFRRGMWKSKSLG